MIHHVLLFAMIISYSIPIIYVYQKFQANTTLSDIICDESCKNTILYSMFVMGFFNILYELQRNDIESIIYILIILFSIYRLLENGVETLYHFLYAGICLFCIFFFMVHHTFLTNSKILFLFTLFNYGIILFMITMIQEDIIICECAFLLFFALFYIYLHFINVSF
jgi:hypothetical protein